MHGVSITFFFAEEQEISLLNEKTDAQGWPIHSYTPKNNFKRIIDNPNFTKNYLSGKNNKKKEKRKKKFFNKKIIKFFIKIIIFKQFFIKQS